MSKSLILFFIICALGIGSVLVYTKNYIKTQKPETIKQDLSKFDFPITSKSPTPKPQDSKFTPIPVIPQVIELQIQDIIEGTGPGVKEGDRIDVNYLGVLLDGRKFDSSYDRGQTFTFTIGEGQVIKGWDQGLIGMKVGGKRKLLIPADLAYGASGNGPIPPNTPLYFEVELVKINL